MQSSYRILRISGISVELHISFIIIFSIALFFASLYGFSKHPGSEGVVQGVFYAIKAVSLFTLLFGTVLLHEFAHSLVALKSGIKVPRITLTPIGGAANIEIPENPKLELLLSIAGPMTNFALLFLALSTLFVLWPGFLFSADFLGYFYINNSGSYFYLHNVFRDILVIPNIFAIIAAMNFFLGSFNLIPAFPMDGGRVLRSVLALFTDYIKASKIAINVSQILAILMLILGLLYGTFLLMLIAFFILITGPSELRIIKIKHALRGKTLGSLAIRDMRYVNESTSIREFLDIIAHPHQSHYPVTDYSGKLIGILDMESLGSIDARDFEITPVKNITHKGLYTVDAKLGVEDTLINLLTKEFILVVDSGQVIGYLTPSRLWEIARFYDIGKG